MTSITAAAQATANMIDNFTGQLMSKKSISHVIDSAFEMALAQCEVLCLPGEEIPNRDYEKVCQQTMANLANLGLVAEQAFLQFALSMFEEHPDFWTSLPNWHIWIDEGLQACEITDTLRSTIHNAVPKILFRLKRKPIIRQLPNGQTIGLDHMAFLQPGKATFAREIMGQVACLGDSPEDERAFEDWALLASTQKRSVLRALLKQSSVDVDQILMGVLGISAPESEQPPSGREEEEEKPEKPEILVRIFDEVDTCTGEKRFCTEYTARVYAKKDERFIEQQLAPRFEFHHV